MKKRKAIAKAVSVETLAHRAMKRPHKRFIAQAGKESEFTNGYTWGFIEGYRIARKAALRQRASGGGSHG